MSENVGLYSGGTVFCLGDWLADVGEIYCNSMKMVLIVKK